MGLDVECLSNKYQPSRHSAWWDSSAEQGLHWSLTLGDEAPHPVKYLD
jgi:hypothetical protein